MLDEDAIAKLVASELSRFRFPSVLEWARGLLVPPFKHLRNWDYGPPGQQFECWLIARFPDGKIGIAYCEGGHACQWGLVWLDDNWIGSDAGWYSRLEDAFVQGGWEGELPGDYEVA